MAEIDPADVSPAATRAIPEPFDKDLSDITDGAPEGKPVREGLPANYRMRADPHYVDLLTSRPAERSGSKEPRDKRADRVLTQLSEDLASIETAAAALAGDASPMARRVNLDLLQAQTWRAAWLLRALALLDGPPRAHHRPRPVGPMLSQVRDKLLAECRLAGVSLHVHTTDWNASVAVDESAVVTGLTGAVLALMALVERGETMAIRVTATAGGGELRTLEIKQDEVTLGGIGSRFFDPSWSDRPGGWMAGVAAAAARACVQQHGGTATLVASDKRGTTIKLNFAAS